MLFAEFALIYSAISMSSQANSGLIKILVFLMLPPEGVNYGLNLITHVSGCISRMTFCQDMFGQPLQVYRFYRMVVIGNNMALPI